MPAALVTSKQLVLYAEGSRYLNQSVLTPKLSYFDQPALRRSFWLLRSTCAYAEASGYFDQPALTPKAFA